MGQIICKMQSCQKTLAMRAYSFLQSIVKYIDQYFLGIFDQMKHCVN